MIWKCPDRRGCMAYDNISHGPCFSRLPFLGRPFNYRNCPTYRKNHHLDTKDRESSEEKTGLKSIVNR